MNWTICIDTRNQVARVLDFRKPCLTKAGLERLHYNASKVTPIIHCHSKVTPVRFNFSDVDDVEKMNKEDRRCYKTWARKQFGIRKSKRMKRAALYAGARKVKEHQADLWNALWLPYKHHHLWG